VNSKQASNKVQAQQVNPNLPLLRQLSPYQIAQMIRDLDSQLIGIEREQDGDELILIYSFAVAGNVQQYPIRVTTQPIASVRCRFVPGSAGV
jgi:hypothetical protein